MSQLLPLAILDELAADLRAERERQEAERAAEWERMQFVSIDFSDDRAGAKVKRALEDAYNKVASAVYDRTGTAYGQAFRLGRLLAHWPISEQDVITPLTSAAQANGSAHKYGDDEILRHIHNGIADGMADPEPLAVPTHDKRGVPLEDAPELDTLTDARAIWDDIKTLDLDANDIQAAPIAEPEMVSVSNRAPTWAEGITDAIWLLALATGNRNLAALFLILAMLDNRGGEFDLYQFGDGWLDYDQLYRVTRQPLFSRVFEEVTYFANFYTLEKDTTVKNSQNTPGQPRRCYRLRDHATVEAELWTAAVDTAFKLASQRSGKRLPLLLKERFAQFLPGVDASNVRTVTAQFNAAFEALAKTDPEVAQDLDAFQARFRDLLDYLDRVNAATDPASEVQELPDYVGLLGKDADYHLKLGAYALRYDQKRVPDRPRTTTLDAFVAGVSVPLITRKRATSGKYGVRELAELRYTADTRVWVDIGQQTPDTLFDATGKAARAEHGYPLFMRAGNSRLLAIKSQNAMQVCTEAAATGSGIQLMLSKSQPMERYDPSKEAAEQPAAKLPRKPRQTTERKPVVRRKAPDVPAIVQDAFTRLMTGHGWSHEADTWADPTGRQYADDAPAILGALTRQLKEIKMLNIHHQAEKYDEPEQLAAERQRLNTAPEPEESLPIVAPAPVAIWADRPAFYELIRPNIFTPRREVYA
jgi:hypothetical protein